MIGQGESVLAPLTRGAVPCDREVKRPLLAVEVERVGLTTYAENVAAFGRSCPEDRAHLAVMSSREVDR